MSAIFYVDICMIAGARCRSGRKNLPVTEKNQNKNTKELREWFSQKVSGTTPPKIRLGLHSLFLGDIMVYSRTMLFICML
jgi:hypothetical protein